MYRRILSLEKWAWYRTDVLIPVTGAATVALLCRWVMPVDPGRLGELGVLVASSGCVLIVAAVAAPLVRMQLAQHSTDKIQAIFGK